MNVLIYANRNKDNYEDWVNELSCILVREGISYEFISQNDFDKKYNADAIFVLGGDGTILAMVDLVNKNQIPIIGINAGKLGFLTEFEKNETEEAVLLFKNGLLKEDKRLTIKTEKDKKVYVSLNDIVIQRIYTGGDTGLVTDLSIDIDKNFVDEISGDGIILSTPTGSTAYSLSAGGSILAPGINALSITPLAAHSLHYRPIVFSADANCEIALRGGSKSGVFIDGKLGFIMEEGDSISVTKHSSETVFLRRENYNFYKRLSDKLSGKTGR